MGTCGSKNDVIDVRDVEVNAALARSNPEDHMFRKMDNDASGEILPKELHAAMKRRGMSDDAISGLFAELDTNGDGKISKEEWRVGYANIVGPAAKAKLPPHLRLGPVLPPAPLGAAQSARQT